MIGVQDEGDVERIGRLLRLRLAVDQVKKMFRLGEVVADGRKRFALARAVKIGGDDADLRGDAAGARSLISRVASLSISGS